MRNQLVPSRARYRVSDTCGACPTPAATPPTILMEELQIEVVLDQNDVVEDQSEMMLSNNKVLQVL
jgi:hypothetical protein